MPDSLVGNNNWAAVCIQTCFINNKDYSLRVVFSISVSCFLRRPSSICMFGGDGTEVFLTQGGLVKNK